MPETISLLEKAALIETNKFMSLVAELKGDQLYMFICAVAELEAPEGADAILEIVSIAKNVAHIDAALNDFYVA